MKLQSLFMQHNLWRSSYFPDMYMYDIVNTRKQNLSFYLNLRSNLYFTIFFIKFMMPTKSFYEKDIWSFICDFSETIP